MANFLYKGTVGGVSPEALTVAVASGAAASISIGDLVVVANGYASKVTNGGGVSTGSKLFGLATSDSTDTVAADGVVDIIYCPSGLVLEGTATTPANLLTAVKFDKVTIDVSGSTQTVDENDPTNGAILISKFVGTDYTTTGKVWVQVPWQNP
jgi:hypothetical protein